MTQLTLLLQPDDEEFAADEEEEIDVEETIEEQEKHEQKHDVKQELDDLKDEGIYQHLKSYKHRFLRTLNSEFRKAAENGLYLGSQIDLIVQKILWFICIKHIILCSDFPD